MARKSDSPATEISFGMLHDLVGYQLRLAQVALFRDFADAFSEYDVTPGLFGVLVIIESNPDLNQSDLARASHLDRSTVVFVIDKLERRGLVERRPSPNDRRSNALQLTRAGKSLLKELKRHVTEHEKRLVANLSQDEQDTLIALLKKIFPEHR